MITKKEAYENMMGFDAHPPVTTMSLINEIIDISSKLGQQAISIYIPIKSLEKFKTSLRKRGFDVQYVTFKSMPEVAYITIVWDIADFAVGERSSEVE
jgi:hypothetical protein